jgi:hypothetical protein
MQFRTKKGKGDMIVHECMGVGPFLLYCYNLHGGGRLGLGASLSIMHIDLVNKKYLKLTEVIIVPSLAQPKRY